MPDIKASGPVIARPPDVITSAFDAAMTRYAFRFRDGTILVRQVGDQRELARFKARGNRQVPIFSLSPDGRYLATTHYPDLSLTVWDVDRGVVAVNHPGRIHNAAAIFSPDSRRFVLVDGRTSPR